jgi:RNA polymerase sigma factor (sigma-70 family)
MGADHKMHDWDAIRKQHGELTYAAAYRIVRNYDMAVDCMQEVFIEVYQNFKSTHVESWPALLRWLAVRRALDALRVQRRIEGRIEGRSENRSEDPSNAFERTSREPAPSQQAEFQELLDRVRLEVAKLPARQAEAFWLHCIEQGSLKEVAATLLTSEGDCRVLIHRARTKLRERLGDLAPKPINHASGEQT